MDFSTEIQYLKGVGPARAEAFSKLGVDTVGALLRFYPRAYEDWSRVVPIREAFRKMDVAYCIIKRAKVVFLKYFGRHKIRYFFAAF